LPLPQKRFVVFGLGIGELVINWRQRLQGPPLNHPPEPKFMRDAGLPAASSKLVTAEDQEAGNGSFVDRADNSQSNIEWIYRSPELDLLTNVGD